MTEQQPSVHDVGSLIDATPERQLPPHNVPFFTSDENQKPVSVDEFFRDNQDVVQVTRDLIAEAKSFVPPTADEDMNGEEYKLRVIGEIKKRIEWRGDYMQGTDQLFNHLEDKDLEHTDLILVALEAQENEIKKSLGAEDVPDTVTMKRLVQSQAEAALIAATAPQIEIQQVEDEPDAEQERIDESEALREIDAAPIPEIDPSSETPKPPLQTHFSFAVVAIPDRAVQDRRRAAAHSFNNDVTRRAGRDRVVDAVSNTVSRIPIPGVNRVAGRVTRGVGTAIAHPVRTIWQNNLARDVFEQEHVRFTTALENTIKEHTDSSVPIAITEELLDIALRHAREAREHISGGRRTWNRLSDSVKAVTGVAQTSEQELARDWLDRQLRLPSEQRNRELQRVIAQTYDEQTALAERFATPVPQGMDIDRANVAGSIIRPELNESRIMLETGSAAAEQTNRKLKELIKNYSTGRVPDTESLVHQINRFIEAELPRSLSPAERRLFHSPEVANNIILLAEEIKKDWARYSTEQDEAGLTAWDKIQFDIYIGRAEWRGPRGPVERGWLTNWLTRNLAENPTVLNKTTGGAYALLKDAGLTTVAYGGAWLTSTVSAAGRTGARLAGGFASVFGLAGLRRSGIDLAHTGMRGIEGGTVHDVTLRSFESAYGRRFDNPEIQRVLVEQTPAEDMTRDILRESINIQTDQDAIRLLTVLADARAKLHLTDLSDTRELLYKTQNYIKYTEGHDNQESLELRRAIHNGVLAIEAYASTHDAFLARYGGRVFSGMPTEYYHRGRRQRPPIEDMGMLEKFTIIREAQLRYSSTDERRMRRWLERTMRLSRSEVDDMMRNIHPYFVEQVTRENSLRRKESCIQRLRAVQLAETMIDSAAATGVMIPVVAVAGELPDMARHTIHGVSTRGLSGIGEYVNHWHEVLQGEAAPETSIQRAVLAAREWWNRPQVAVPVEQAPVAGSGHDVVVSGTRIELDPVTHKYDMIALGPDGSPILDAHGKPVLLIDNATVDPVTGKVSADYINPALMIHEVPPTEALTGNAAVEHWLKLSTKVDHIKWWVHNPQIEQHLYDSSTENAAGSRVIEFRLSNVGVAHQGSESIDVGQLVKDNKIAFALTLPGHLHEPIIIDASSGAVHNGVLRLDPDDYSHFIRVGAEQRAIGDIARDLIKQEELKQLPAGNLGTEVFGRQQVLHLTDSLQKAGHIQAVYIEEQNGKIIEHSFSTIRACGQVEVGGGQAGAPNIVLPNGMTVHVDNATEAPPVASRLLGGAAPLQRMAGRLSDLALHAVPFGARTNLDRSRSAEAPRSERQHRNLVQEIIETRRAYAETMEKVERNINRKENLREVSRLRAQLAIMQDQLRRSAFGQQPERHPAAPPSSLPLSESGDMPSPRSRRSDPNADISDDELRESIRRAGLRVRSRSPEGPIHLSRDMQTAIIERYNQLLPDGERRLDPQSIMSEYNTIIAPQIRKLINEGTSTDSYAQLRDLASTLSDVMWTSNGIIIPERQHREVARMIIGRIVAGELTLADLPEEQLQESPLRIKQPGSRALDTGDNDFDEWPPFLRRPAPEAQATEELINYRDISNPIEAMILQEVEFARGQGVPARLEWVFRSEYNESIAPAIRRAMRMYGNTPQVVYQSDLASEIDMALRRVEAHLTTEQILAISNKIIENIGLQRFTEADLPPEEESIPSWLRDEPEGELRAEVKDTNEADINLQNIEDSTLRYILQEVIEARHQGISTSMEGILRADYMRIVVPALREIKSLSVGTRMSQAPRLGMLIEMALQGANISLPGPEPEQIAVELIKDMNWGRLYIPPEQSEPQAEATVKASSSSPDIPDWLRDFEEQSQRTQSDVPPWLQDLGDLPPRTEAKPKEIPLHPDAQWFRNLPELTIQGDLIPSAEGHIAGAEILSIDNQPIPFEIVKLDEGLMGVRAMSRNVPTLEVFTDNLGFDTVLTSRPGSAIAYMPTEASYALIGNDVYEIKGAELVRTDEQTAINIRERADKIRIGGSL